MKVLRSLPWRTLVVAAAALAVFAAPGAPGVLGLDRAAASGGEWWRILTGHLVHGSSHHLAWNVAALIGLGLVFEPTLGRRLWLLLAAGAGLVGSGVLLLQPGLDAYHGLSGTLNALWVGGCITLARREPGPMRHVYAICVALGLAKIVFEATAGVSIFTDPAELGGRPLPLAHALGSLAGCVVPGSRTRQA